jgi:prepilin-type N-terminal cleavage/methylation domain-containing protein
MFLVRRRKTGFTLVELLIVIVIIGILAGMMMLATGVATDKAQATKIVNNMRTLKSAVLMYYMDNYKWPDSGNETTNNKGIGASVLKGYVDQSKITDNINGEYTIVSRSTDVDNSGNKNVNYNGSVFIKYTNETMSAGLKQQLALMAPKANLWNSSELITGTDKKFGYYNGIDGKDKSNGNPATIHMPVYISTSSWKK